MALSDEITLFIRELLQQSDGVAELQRSDLAGRFHCAPSQINYVISTRFAPEQGYLIESRRGGGGYIRITRIQASTRSLLMHAVNSVGQHIDARSAAAFTANLLHADALSGEQASLLLAVTSDNALRPVPQPLRDITRANLFKHVLLTIIERS